MLAFIIRILTAPFRFLARLLRGSAPPARAAGKTGAGSAAKKAAPREILGEEFAEKAPGGIEALFFRQLPRPRLTERSASDLGLDEAREHLQYADQFYNSAFPLFARGDLFYEEVEEQYLNNALGFGQNSIDQRFLEVMTLFRRTLNSNTKRLLVVYAPILLIVSLASGLTLAPALGESFAALVGASDVKSAGIFAASLLAAAGGFILTLILFSWPFLVAQQRNLLNLDNYITSKFARINNNFQVAKRRALNVERNMRMAQADELKEEAGVWTMTYQWFAMRLFLCELMIRNRFYQIRRNTILYWLAGAFASLAITAGAAYAAGRFFPAPDGAPLAILASGAAFTVFSYALMQRTTSVMFSVLEANEWSRFCLVNLPKTIRDHVGEDKVQIVTFRDRNRFE
ncbi:MAG: hypothetical protein RIA10_09775 [Amphiplicatus sp.]